MAANSGGASWSKDLSVACLTVRLNLLTDAQEAPRFDYKALGGGEHRGSISPWTTNGLHPRHCFPQDSFIGVARRARPLAVWGNILARTSAIRQPSSTWMVGQSPEETRQQRLGYIFPFFVLGGQGRTGPGQAVA